MQLKNRYILLLVLFLIIALYFLSPTYIGFVVNNESTNSTNQTLIQSPLVKIELTSKTFGQGMPLTGVVRLNLSGVVNQDDTITLSTDNQESERSLADLVKILNVPHRELQTIYEGENPQQTKQLVFDSEDSKFVGIKVRSKSNVVSFKLDIEGKENNGEYPNFPKLDIGAKSSYYDWEYHGDLDSYDTTPIIASGLELTNTEEQIIITNVPKTIYCEKVTLPESRAFKLSAKYKKTSDLGDIKLKILNSDFSIIPTAECDAPEDTNLDWHECDLTLDRKIEGEKLICFYSSKDQSSSGLAQLSIDPVTTSENPNSNGYACNENFDCQLTPPTDYYIRAFPGIYSKTLSTKESFENWTTSPSVEILSFNNHLANCEPFDFSRVFCMVPIKITSESSGIIELSNLELKYMKDGSTFSPVVELNDLTYTEASVELLEDDVELEIPIVNFNLIAPATKTAILKVETSIGLSAEKNYDVKLIASEVTLEPIPAILNRISVSKATLTRLQSDEVTIALGLTEKINSVFDEITNIENQVNTIQASTNLTQVGKEVKVSELNIKLEEILKQIPKDYDIKTTFKFSPPIMSFEELSSEIPINQDTSYKIAVLNSQEEVDIDAEAKLFDIVYSDGERQTATTIIKTITPKETLTNVEIIEKIPKSIAKSVSKIGFATPFTTLKDDPVIKFSLDEISPQNPGRITYAVYEDVFAYVEDTSTLYLPATISNDLIGIDCGNNFCNFLEDYTSCPEDCLCGNRICDLGEELNCPSDCKKFPWTLVISLIIIGLLTIFGMYYYLVIAKDPIKKKAFLGKLRKIPIIGLFFKEKKLVKGQDIQKLKAFIKNASLKGYSKQQIKQILLKKGWKEEQINEAFKS